MKKNINIFENKNHFIKNKKKTKNIQLFFGRIGLISLQSGYIKEHELNACKKNILKNIKKIGKKYLYLKRKPFLNITSKPIAMRMGKGKGSIDKVILPVQPGTVLFEINCKDNQILLARKAFSLSRFSLSIKTKIFEYIY